MKDKPTLKMHAQNANARPEHGGESDKPAVSDMRPDGSLWMELAKAGVAMLHHETDLYVPVTAETKTILAKFPLQETNAERFKSNIDGVLMFDVPFAYEPEWARKLGKNGLGDIAIASEGQHIGKVVDICNGYAVQNVGRGMLVAHDVKALSLIPKIGEVMNAKYTGKKIDVQIVEQDKAGVQR